MGTDAKAYYEGLQVQSRDAGAGVATYRSHLNTYTVRRPLPVAESVARANAQFGAGGLRQYFVPDRIGTLVEEGWVSEPVTTPMTNLVADIPPSGRPIAESGSHRATTGACR